MLNDDAVAYSFVFIIVFVFAMAVLVAFLAVPVNKVTGFMNSEIGQGHISQQTKTTYEWNLGFFLGLPGLILLGLVLFGIVVAIERSNAGGSL